jgi:hypothetical protein
MEIKDFKLGFVHETYNSRKGHVNSYYVLELNHHGYIELTMINRYSPMLYDFYKSVCLFIQEYEKTYSVKFTGEIPHYRRRYASYSNDVIYSKFYVQEEVVKGFVRTRKILETGSFGHISELNTKIYDLLNLICVEKNDCFKTVKEDGEIHYVYDNKNDTNSKEISIITPSETPFEDGWSFTPEEVVSVEYDCGLCYRV